MRVKKTREFNVVRAEGRRVAKGCLVANWKAQPPGQTSRLGVITSRKLGNAVVRSRARRLLRETFRLHQNELDPPLTLILVARNSIIGKNLAGVERDFLAVLREARLLGAKD